jgi:hypothetical protein
MWARRGFFQQGNNELLKSHDGIPQVVKNPVAHDNVEFSKFVAIEIVERLT